MKVLRHNVGDTLHCVDGQGHQLTARIVSGNDRRVELEVLEVEQNWHEPAHPRVLLFAPPKARDRLEWLLQKATELGATHLLPVDTARTERTRIKQERARGILVSAMKQCMRSRMPQLFKLQALASALKQLDGIDNVSQRWVAHCDQQRPQSLDFSVLKGHGAVFAIGPEGDFAPEEIAMLQASGFVGIDLGEQRLRTETAAIYVLTAHHWAQLQGA